LRIDATSLGEGRGSVWPAQQYQVAAEFGQLVFGSMPVRLEPSLAVWKEGDDHDTLLSELGRGHPLSPKNLLHLHAYVQRHGTSFTILTLQTKIRT
jgi:hypothetical protein